jgi:hypothetical protein
MLLFSAAFAFGFLGFCAVFLFIRELKIFVCLACPYVSYSNLIVTVFFSLCASVTLVSGELAYFSFSQPPHIYPGPNRASQIFRSGRSRRCCQRRPLSGSCFLT